MKHPFFYSPPSKTCSREASIGTTQRENQPSNRNTTSILDPSPKAACGIVACGRLASALWLTKYIPPQPRVWARRPSHEGVRESRGLRGAVGAPLSPLAPAGQAKTYANQEKICSYKQRILTRIHKALHDSHRYKAMLAG